LLSNHEGRSEETQTAGRLRAHVIRPKEVKPGWVLLYAITFALQWVSATARFAVAFPALWLALDLSGHSTAPTEVLALLMALGPLVLSLATLVLPTGSWLWRLEVGGRAPSGRERLIYEDALCALKEADPALRPPRRWFVLDEPRVNAGAYADTLMVTRGLLESGYLEPVLAHELGHLNSSDARVTSALRRMTTRPRARLPFPLRTMGLLFSGAAAMWVVRVPWAAYWRSREFEADAYAARLGQGQAAAQFLEAEGLEQDLPVPFAWLSEHSHPPTEHRIDRLEGLAGSG
jgi:Zn-dependent protease with chaperone function